MSDDLWIVVPGWERFQHYGNRRDSPWLKVYAELNSREEWRRLPYSERGLLVSIWIEYQRSGGQLRATDIGSRCGQRVRLRSLEALNHAGFIHFSASKPLALTRSREKSREEKKELAPARAKPRQLDDAHKANAAAYRPFQHPDPETFDPAGIELLKEWLKR